MESRLKILFCTDSLMSGGVESQLVELATRLDRQKFHVEVLCLYGEKAGHSEYFIPVLRNAGIEVYLLDLTLSPYAKLKGIYEIIQLIYRCKPDIVQAENYHANLLTRLARLFIPYPFKLLGTVRGTYTSKQLRYERLSYFTCRCIITNAPQLRDLLIKRASIPPQKVRYIPNGVDLHRFASVSQASQNTHYLLTVGRIHPEKQIHLIVDALGLLKEQNKLADDLRLLIVGKSQDAESQALLDDTIKRYSLEQVVICYGEAEHVETLYEAAQLTILFSPAEGLPNVVLESLAAGRPVIISEAANAARIIEHGITGWIVKTGDTRHLAETLNEALQIPHEQFRIMQAQCQTAASNFSIQKMVQRYTALYDEVLELRS